MRCQQPENRRRIIRHPPPHQHPVRVVPSLPIADGIERAAQTFVDNDRMAASESM